jgi:hypothetical protein
MTADFTIISDLGASLNFHKGSDPGPVANLTTIKINEAMNTHLFPELYIGCYSAKLWRRGRDRNA